VEQQRAGNFKAAHSAASTPLQWENALATPI
jgi:hypothetical protein